MPSPESYSIAPPTSRYLFLYKLTIFVLILFGSRLVLIDYAGSRLPFWDQWDAQAFNLFSPWLNGTFDGQTLFAPHNEHRIFFTRLLTLSLLEINGQWDTLVEQVVNAVLQIINAIILIVALRSFFGHRIENYAFVLIGILWILPFGWENTLFGFHSPFYLMFMFTLLAIVYLLTSNTLSWKWWIGAFCALCAFFNLASGLLLLPVLALIATYQLFVLRESKRHQIALLITIAVIGAICIPLIASNPGHEALKPANVVEFFTALGKSLAWPYIDYAWMALPLYFPFFLFVTKTVLSQRRLSQGDLFIIALGGWVLVQAVAMAYARGHTGMAPASRYMDILAVGPIVCFFSLIRLMQLPPETTTHAQPIATIRHKWLRPLLICWFILLAVGLGFLMIRHTLPSIALQPELNNYQLQHVRAFYESGEQLDTLENKPFLHIPYPDAARLAMILSKPETKQMLMPSINVPKFSDQQLLSNQGFVLNGYYPKGQKYPGADVYGSYGSQGNAQQGKITLGPFDIKQHYMEIPISGYLGEENLTLELTTESGKRLLLTPQELAKETWHMITIPSPGEPFQLIAIDNNSTKWFAFAAPRGLGILSYTFRFLLKYSQAILASGLFFILILLFIRVNRPESTQVTVP